MRFLLVIALFAASANAEPKLEDLAWLAGHWGGTVDGVVMEEVWLAPAGGVMPGTHRDLRGARSSFEFMRIAETSAGIVFYAQPGGNAATAFRLVESGERRAVFANPQHDFPQRIVYWRAGEELCARVEGAPGESANAEEWCWSRR